ncbi:MULTISPECIES: V-type proton ATPase subunit E [Methanobacterium]|jgi:V/A-type H+-transporting ATPase subunit E|uniref:A-type ATP synthase subunit E n=1 Tax=Methanobacterium veterum TaxID=408577 RepID=A0A9E4ZZI0_9EURY|nr:MULTISPECIES: V-type proton ATPase subunit E [Methanobacterium]MCZ3366334.1 V-type proton ATPase subunit E [Methanobacterium veterum]MCZ3371842.1 V-type proton ATPase subunit E [Methanobacterium veterum]
MNSGADKIVSSIISDAQSKADVIIQEAERETALIVEEGEKEAVLEKEKILENANKQSAMKYQQLISEAKMNSRRAELEAREEIIESAFKRAEDELKKIASTDSDEYKESLKKIIEEASIEIGGGDLILSLKADDVAKVKDAISSLEKNIEGKTGTKTTLEIGENIATIGGAVVKTKNGDIEVNNTIEARMLRFKKALRSEVAKILFK